MKLPNKIAVITGGNSGIGLATAHEFKQQGARVIIIGRNPAAVAAAATEVGGDTLGLVADVSKVADLEAAFRVIQEKYGRVDILFANAGIAKFAPLAEVSEAFFVEQVAINVKGAYFTAQKALPLLAEGASVIFTSSTVSHFGMPGSSVYSLTKAALINLAKTLAVELAGKKIRVNVVSPGPIATPILAKWACRRPRCRNWAAPSWRKCRWRALAKPAKSPGPSRTWPPRMPPMSPARNCSWTAAWRRRNDNASGACFSVRPGRISF